MTASILYNAAKKTLVEYFQKTSLNGFGLLYYIRRRKYQRLFWFLFIVMGITFAIYVCMSTIVSFLSEPTVTTLDTQKHTIWNVPFPSIAVCSNNKLSHNAIRKFAQNITYRSLEYYPYKYWKEKLKLFAGLFNTDSVDFDDALKFQNELEFIYGKLLSTRELLKILAPTCKDLIVQCHWAGEIQNCEEQFKLLAFTEGYCCVFNYQYGSKKETLYYPPATGLQMGLALVLNCSTNDYFYAEDSASGFNVQIFGDQHIPDTSTGEVVEFYVSAGEDVDVKLNVFSQITKEEARAHSVGNRGCYFPNEHKEAGHGLSDCLLKCKVRSIESLCGCVPFYAYDIGMEDNAHEVVDQCNLFHSECLEHYRITWLTYHPQKADLIPGFKEELVDSITCPDCLPLCSFNRYHYRKVTGNLSKTLFRPANRKYLSSFSKFPPDLSLVKIYFPSDVATKFQKNVLYNWYQILSSIGGVIGICMGCSIISGFEIIYFATFRLFQNYVNLKKNAKWTS